MPRRPQDSSLFVKFSRRSVLNEAKSWGAKILDNENKVIETIEGAGRPIHDNIDFVHIEIPGDRDNIIERHVTCCDKELLKPGAKLAPHCRARLGFDDRPMIEECDVHRFFDEYERFKGGQEHHEEGTDLKSWTGLDAATAEDLAYFRVHTVEQLAAMNDSNVGQFHSQRQRARDFLAEAKKGQASVNVRAELDASARALATERDARLALERQVQELLAAQPKPSATAKAKGA